MQAQSLIRWPQPITEYVGFLASFLPAGAVGFRFAVLRGATARAGKAGADPSLGRIYTDSARRAAGIGLIGTIIGATLLLYQLPGLGARKHLTASQFVATNAGVQLQIGFLILALIGFALALRRSRLGWVLAAVGFIAGILRNAFLAQWGELANPLHVLAAGLWIGTLFIMLVAGITTVLRDELSRASRRTGQRYGLFLFAVGTQRGSGARALRRDHRVAASACALESVDHALRHHADREAMSRGHRVRARRMELASAKTNVRERRCSAGDSALGD